MSIVFISHASTDDTVAAALETWLTDNGITDLFVDHENISGGEKWREALRAAANSCRVVICLVTPNWLGSAECFSEFGAAWYMGRRIIALFLLPPGARLDDEARKRLARIQAEDQGIDVWQCVDASGSFDIRRSQAACGRLLTGLKGAGAITRVGLDPESFSIDKIARRVPFPGLLAFQDDDADAALFYGRSREIAHILEDLRSMRALRDQRPLVIQGASGAGKSSLLRAGIIPRLRRETPAWLPLRAFRPGADPLLNFAAALSRTLEDFGQREAQGDIRDRLRGAWAQAIRNNGDLTAAGCSAVQGAIEEEGKRLRRIANRLNASILISVDQAEELARADNDSCDALSDYLRAALTSEASSWQVAFTIRTDSLPELQRHRRFQDLEARGYDLRAIPVFRFDNVVEEPARRYGVEVEEALIDALIEDAPREDSLPLLAFALQRLWEQYAGSGRLTLNHYRRFGGLRGLIEDAAERALRGIEPEGDTPLPRGEPTKRQIELARWTFVPALVQINDQGLIIRRARSWRAFNPESQELLNRFDRWRLVVKKSAEHVGDTVEVAHEALFREWERLKEWLEPERARLDALRTLQADAVTWKKKAQDNSFLNHHTDRLNEVEALAANAAFSVQLSEDDQAYIAACRAGEQQRRTRSRRAVALISALALLLVVGTAGAMSINWLRDQYQWRIAMQGAPLTLLQERQFSAKPGTEFKECEAGCPPMVVVPAGQFAMGSPDGKGDDDETPQHPVAVPKPIAISKFEITFAEWDRCVEAKACARAADFSVGLGPAPETVDCPSCPPTIDRVKRASYPVVNVSWDDAQHYAAWLSRLSGRSYRLLSEAEWEYAARAGSTKRHYFGEDITQLSEHAWYLDNADKQSHAVGGKKPNAFGLYDVYGNVLEMVEDCWNENYADKPETLNRTAGAWISGDCRLRVFRGGAWTTASERVNSSIRSFAGTGDRAAYVGFRLVRNLKP